MTICVQHLLATYQTQLQNLFMDELVGIYLSGSIALGEFIDGKSDIDCTVLLKSPLPIDKLDSVKKIHQKLSSQYKNVLLESQYISCDNIGKSEANTQPFYACHDNKISFAKFSANEVTWFTLKNYGITITGVPANELDIHISVQDVQIYVKNNVNDYWTNWLNDTRKTFSYKRGTALTNQAIEWCVCGISRMYYTMKEGDITSKGKAVEYALTCLPKSTHKILKEALRIRKGEKNKLYHSRFIRREDMIAYMAYLIEQIKNIR